MGKNSGKFKVSKLREKAEDVEKLIEDNSLEFLELDQNIKTLGDNVPYNIKKTKADSVWNLTNGSGVKAAILDTGISQHDDLENVWVVSYVDNNYFDSNGHGTAVPEFWQDCLMTRD